MNTAADFFKSRIQDIIDRDRAMCAKHGFNFRERTADAAFSHGDFIGAVLGIETPEDATMFRDGYLEIMAADGVPPDKAQELARSNLGWCMGEGMKTERIAMWHEVGAMHPVFGSMATRPTFDEAIEAGKRLASESA